MGSFRQWSVLLLLMSLSGTNASADDTIEKLLIGSFSSGSLDQWELKDFSGQTRYQLVDLAGVKVLKADSRFVIRD